MDDLISEFISETTESLSVLDAELVKLERNPGDHEILSTIYRLMHTIKGTCGFLGLPRLESVAQAVETVLAKVHGGDIIMGQSTSFVLLEALSSIRNIVTHLADSGMEPDGSDAELIARLKRIAAGDMSMAPPAKPKPAAKEKEPVAPVAQKIETPQGEKPALAEAAITVTMPPLEISHPVPATVEKKSEILSQEAKQQALRHGLEAEVPAAQLSRGLLEKIAGALTDLIHARNQLKQHTPSAPILKLNTTLRALKEALAMAERETQQPSPINVQSVLVVHAAGQAIALPQRNMLEVVDLSMDRDVRVATINNTSVLIKQKRVLPLVKLRSLLKLSDFPSMREDQVVIMRVGAAEFGLVVERVGELTEVVLEKLPKLVRSMGLYQGSALISERSLMLVMDALGMARAIGFRQVEEAVPQITHAHHSPDNHALKGFLVFRAGEGAPKALLVDQVVRIDGMAHRAADIRVATLPGIAAPAEGAGEVVVVKTAGEPVALAVDKVIDVLHAPYALQASDHHAAYLGTVELPGMTAELVNIDHIASLRMMEAA